MLQQRLQHHNCQQCLRAHVSTYPSWWIGAYLAAKQPRHVVRVSTWLGERILVDVRALQHERACGNAHGSLATTISMRLTYTKEMS